jgi:hypothetical protein
MLLGAEVRNKMTKWSGGHGAHLDALEEGRDKHKQALCHARRSA